MERGACFKIIILTVSTYPGVHNLNSSYLYAAGVRMKMKELVQSTNNAGIMTMHGNAQASS